MKIDLRSSIKNLLNFKEKEKPVKSGHRNELIERVKRGQAIKDAVKTEFWQNVLSQEIIDNIENGIGSFLRPSSLDKSESEIKSIMADMQAYASLVGKLKYYIDSGEEASKELEKLDKAKK